MYIRLIPGIVLALIMAAEPVPAAGEIVVYSARKEHLIKPLFDLYTEQTGTPVRYITDKAGPLLQRLDAEGKRTRADLLITVDAGNLWQAGEKGVLASVTSPLLEANVPPHLRDPQQRWFGLSVRARTIVYSTERIKPETLSTYEDLADPKWKGRLCLRTSKKVYNQSLVAMMISHLGQEKAEQVVRGWVDNLAAPPFSNDTKTMQAILAGRCDLAIVNTYYYGRLQKEKPDVKLALFWPDQEGYGVHVNVSGAGVTRHAPHRESAVKLLEWLSSADAQRLLADMNMEYPVNPRVPPAPEVAAWGDFKADTLNVADAGRLQAEAVRLMDRAGYR